MEQEALVVALPKGYVKGAILHCIVEAFYVTADGYRRTIPLFMLLPVDGPDICKVTKFLLWPAVQQDSRTRSFDGWRSN